MTEAKPLWEERTRAGAPTAKTGRGNGPGDVLGCQDGLHRLGEEVGGCIWSGRPLSCLVIDIQGETGGDGGPGEQEVNVLQGDIASLLACSVRSSDHVAWLEGGQFLVIAPETNAKAAWTMGNRLLAKLRRHRFSAPGRGRVALMVTIGTASCAGGPVSEPFDLVERAGEAVGRGKVGGGNRVVSA